jgi:hypothetical protein
LGINQKYGKAGFSGFKNSGAMDYIIKALPLFIKKIHMVDKQTMGSPISAFGGCGRG